MTGAAPSHTSTAEWQSFEVRMRRRCVERYLARARTAIASGQPDQARVAIAEVRYLDPLEPALAELDRQIEAAAAAPIIVRVTAVVAARVAAMRPAATASEPRAVRPLVVAAAVLGPIVTLGPLFLWAPPPDYGSRTPPGTVATPQSQPPGAIALAATPAEPAVEASAGVADPRADVRAGAESSPVSQDVPPEPAAKPSEEPAAPSGILVPATPVEPPPASLASVTRTPEPAAPALPESPVTALLELPAGLNPTVPPPPPEPAPGSIPAHPDATPPSAAPDDTVRDAPRTERPTVAAAPAPIDGREQVRRVLSKYESAYNALDAGAVRSVWPGVDEASLEHAFSALESQRVWLGACEVTVNGSTANARCAGAASWKPKVGTEVRGARRWTFDLRNASGEWQIVRVQAR